ncbi:MAG: hypothetical protein ACOC0N_09750 [Chroococcales cyanobacterium]
MILSTSRLTSKCDRVYGLSVEFMGGYAWPESVNIIFPDLNVCYLREKSAIMKWR